MWIEFPHLYEMYNYYYIVKVNLTFSNLHQRNNLMDQERNTSSHK